MSSRTATSSRHDRDNIESEELVYQMLDQRYQHVKTKERASSGQQAEEGCASYPENGLHGGGFQSGSPCW